MPSLKHYDTIGGPAESTETSMMLEAYLPEPELPEPELPELPWCFMDPTLPSPGFQAPLPSERPAICRQPPSDIQIDLDGKSTLWRMASKDPKVQDPKARRALAGNHLPPPPIFGHKRRHSLQDTTPPKWNRRGTWDPRERRPYIVAKPRAGVAASTLSPSQSILASSWLHAQAIVPSPPPPGQNMMQQNAFGQTQASPFPHPAQPQAFQDWASPMGSPFPSALSSTSQIWGSSAGDSPTITLSYLSHMAQPFNPLAEPSGSSSTSTRSLSPAQGSPLIPMVTSPPAHSADSADSARSGSPQGPNTPPPQEAPRRMFQTCEDMQRANAIWDGQNFARRIWESEQEGIANYGAEAWKIGKLRARENAHNEGRECTLLRTHGKYSRDQFYPQEKCVICMERAPDMGYVPCGHLVTCRECQSQLATSGGGHLCPLCRIKVVDCEYLPASKQISPSSSAQA